MSLLQLCKILSTMERFNMWRVKKSIFEVKSGTDDNHEPSLSHINQTVSQIVSFQLSFQKIADILNKRLVQPLDMKIL